MTMTSELATEPRRPAGDGSDAMPEYILDDRRSILWQLCEDGSYAVRAGDLADADLETASILQELQTSLGDEKAPAAAAGAESA